MPGAAPPFLPRLPLSRADHRPTAVRRRIRHRRSVRGRREARGRARAGNPTLDGPCARPIDRTRSGWSGCAGSFASVEAPPYRGQWPVPHNALFDFEATSAGTECIDEITSKARKILDNPPGKMVVGHAEWSAKQFRFEEGRVCVIYDWDSLRLDKKINLVWAYGRPFLLYGILRRASPSESRRSAALRRRVRDGTQSSLLRTRVRSHLCGGYVWTRVHGALRACPSSRGKGRVG